LHKEVPPKPPSRNSIALGLLALLFEESQEAEVTRSFWKGAWGETFFQKGSPQIASLKASGVSG